MPFIKLIKLIGIVPFLFIHLPDSAIGQQAELETGSMVRISAPDIYEGRFIGVVNEITDNYLIASSEFEDLAIHFPYSAIKRIDISTGKRDGIKEGLMAGFVAAAVSGLLAHTYLENKRTPPPCENLICFRKNQLLTKEDTPKIALYTGLSVAIFAFGIARQSNKWEKLPVNIRLHQSSISSLHLRNRPVITLRIPIGMQPSKKN